MSGTRGSLNKRYVSAIAFFDQREISREVVDVQNEDDFLDILHLAGRQSPVGAWDYHNHVNSPLFRVVDSTGGVVTGSGTATVGIPSTLATSGHVRVGDIGLFPDKKEGRVSQVTTSAGVDTLTFNSVDGTNLTLVAGNKIAIMSRAEVEESDAPAALRFPYTKYMNKLQVFRESSVISDVQKAAKLEVTFKGQPYIMYADHAQKLSRMRGMIAAQFIAGKMSLYSFSDATPGVADAFGNTFQTTRGLDDYISSYGITDSLVTPGTVTNADIDDLGAQLIAAKSIGDYLALGSSAALAAYDTYLTGLGSSGVTTMRLKIDGREVDLTVDRWRKGGIWYNKARMPILDHSQIFNFSGSAGFQKMMYFLPLSKVKTKDSGLVPRWRSRYMPTNAGGVGPDGASNKGDNVIMEVHQGLFAPRPVGRIANFTADWYTAQGFEALGVEHFAKQQVIA